GRQGRGPRRAPRAGRRRRRSSAPRTPTCRRSRSASSAAHPARRPLWPPRRGRRRRRRAASAASGAGAEPLVVLLEHLAVLGRQAVLDRGLHFLAVLVAHLAPAVGDTDALLQVADGAVALGQAALGRRTARRTVAARRTAGLPLLVLLDQLLQLLDELLLFDLDRLVGLLAAEVARDLLHVVGEQMQLTVLLP